MRSGADAYVVCLQHRGGDEQSRSMPTHLAAKKLRQEVALSPEAKKTISELLKLQKTIE